MPKLCFILGPIGEEGSETRIHSDWVLHGIIEPVLSKRSDFDVRRADQDARPGLITSQIITDLHDAELVIADLAFHIPNVFYEIGIRHMVVKPIIHLLRAGEKPPFDVSGYRAVPYSRNTFQEQEKAKEELDRAVEAVLDPNYQVDNPVTFARGRTKLREDATPAIRLLIDEVEAIKIRQNALETQMLDAITPRGALPDYGYFGSGVIPSPGARVIPRPGIGTIQGVIPSPLYPLRSDGAFANRAIQSTTGIVGVAGESRAMRSPRNNR